MNGIAGPMGFLKDPVPQLVYLAKTQSSLVPQNTSPLRRMPHLACQGPILSTPSMTYEGIVWTSPQIQMMTRIYDGL